MTNPERDTSINQEYRARAAARALDERGRIDAILSRATPIEGCGPAIPIAPARGPQVLVTPVAIVPDVKDKSGWSTVDVGWRGFKATRAMDVFDDLAMRAAKRGAANPFTPQQVAVARLYRDLVERHSAGGMRCISGEARGGSGPTAGGEFIDAFIEVGRRIAWLRNRIGPGVAMSVRRVRPSARGGVTAGIIHDRTLVDAICLHGKSFANVLDEHGWAVAGKNRACLVAAMACALERMGGGGVRSSKPS